MDDLISTTRGVRQRRKARGDGKGKGNGDGGGGGGGGGGFTVGARTRFLDALAVTCNISKAAAFAGVHPTTVYKTRAKDAAFAEQWVAAMAIGYDRLEALVLEHGGAGAEIEIDPERATAQGLKVEPFDFERAMKVLVYRRGARDGLPNRRTGRPVRNATREETNAALMKALKAAHRRVEASRARDA